MNDINNTAAAIQAGQNHGTHRSSPGFQTTVLVPAGSELKIVDRSVVRTAFPHTPLA